MMKNNPNRHKIRKKFTMPDPSPNIHKGEPKADAFLITREPMPIKINRPQLNIYHGSTEPKPTISPPPIPSISKPVATPTPIKPKSEVELALEEQRELWRDAHGCKVCGMAVKNHINRCPFCGHFQ